MRQMAVRRVSFGAALLPAFLLSFGAAQNPKVTLSTLKVTDTGHVDVHGVGFSPNQTVTSHLRRPDETEYPPLRIRTDAHGEFTHTIQGQLLMTGTHELWVVDDHSKTISNTVRFTVEGIAAGSRSE
jgi:hypothetical protein